LCKAIEYIKTNKDFIKSILKEVRKKGLGKCLKVNNFEQYKYVDNSKSIVSQKSTKKFLRNDNENSEEEDSETISKSNINNSMTLETLNDNISWKEIEENAGRENEENDFFSSENDKIKEPSEEIEEQEEFGEIEEQEESEEIEEKEESSYDVENDEESGDINSENESSNDESDYEKKKPKKLLHSRNLRNKTQQSTLTKYFLPNQYKRRSSRIENLEVERQKKKLEEYENKARITRESRIRGFIFYSFIIIIIIIIIIITIFARFHIEYISRS
jgi:hypothetical protein